MLHPRAGEIPNKHNQWRNPSGRGVSGPSQPTVDFERCTCRGSERTCTMATGQSGRWRRGYWTRSESTVALKNCGACWGKGHYVHLGWSRGETEGKRERGLRGAIRPLLLETWLLCKPTHFPSLSHGMQLKFYESRCENGTWSYT